MEEIKIIYLRKEEVDHCTVNRWFKKFHVDCKNHDNQAKSGIPKTVDSKVMLRWAIDSSLTGITILGQSGPGSNGNERILYSSQISKSWASLSEWLIDLLIN